jgi:hypothetical protein
MAASLLPLPAAAAALLLLLLLLLRTWLLARQFLRPAGRR